MGVKIKVFKAGIDSSDAMSEFMGTVNVIENGILLTENSYGVLYKDKDDVGMSTSNLVGVLSGELASAQKNFIKQEGLVHGYQGMVDKFQAIADENKNKADEARKILDAHMSTFDIELQAKYDDIKGGMEKVKRAWQATGKTNPKKAKLEEEYYELENKFKEVDEIYSNYNKEFTAKTTELTNAVSLPQINMANALGKVKENKNFIDTCVDDRDHARVFIATTKALIQDLLDGKVEGAGV